MSYLEDMFSLRGQTVIVTGGAGAIGTEMSATLLQAGADVIIWSRTRESIEQALDKFSRIEASIGTATGICCDTGREDAVKQALAESLTLTGRVDVLINGVGGNMGKAAFVETDMAVFEKVLHLNLVAGLMAPTKVVAQYWIEQSIRGAIINLTSMASYNPLSGVWAYDAAKAAVLNLTTASANEFAKHGIRVNAIAPGFFIGKQNRALLIDQTTGELTDRGKAVIAHTPFGRFGDVAELAGATLFLASNKASGFVTGISIPVDGGYLAYNI